MNNQKLSAEEMNAKVEGFLCDNPEIMQNASGLEDQIRKNVISAIQYGVEKQIAELCFTHVWKSCHEDFDAVLEEIKQKGLLKWAGEIMSYVEPEDLLAGNLVITEVDNEDQFVEDLECDVHKIPSHIRGYVDWHRLWFDRYQWEYGAHRKDTEVRGKVLIIQNN